MPVDPLEPLVDSSSAGELRAEDRLALDPELLGDRRAGDHVVAGDHPTRMCAGCASSTAGFDSARGGVDHADEARHLEALDVAEQVAVGVERVRVEVAVRRRHDPEAGLAHPLHVRLGPRCAGRHPMGCC